MEHAAMGIAAVARLLAPPPARILVCCGPGNNGGDGYGAARFLHRWGSPTTVLQLAPGPPGSDDGRLEHGLCDAQLGVAPLWEHPDAFRDHLGSRPALVLDALFGVGVTRALGSPYLEWIEALNASGLPVLAVDLPSGLDADTGRPLPEAIRAVATATMVAPKPGISPGAPGAAYAGRVVEVDIGLPGTLLEGLRIV
jgi:NAD(P)H-hydrate epimerase